MRESNTHRLNTREVVADGASPDRWLAILHGIYGAGRNWASVARAIATQRPEWGAVLVDLRQHGESGGFPPPHTLEAAAADLDGIPHADDVLAILGHSFGGKVALQRAASDSTVRQVWVADSTPDAREPAGSAWEMLGALRRLPHRFDDRDDAVSALVDQGVARPIALWMSTNLVHDDGEYRWRIDFDDMEALLRDFFRRDLWHVVEAPRDGLAIHFLRATDSSVITPDAADRIKAAGQATGRVFLHEVEGGHWLNADNPDAVVQLVVDGLPQPSKA